MENNSTLKMGIASGTLLSVIPNLLSEDIFHTIVLAVLGAVASFLVTVLLKWFARSKKK